MRWVTLLEQFDRPELSHCERARLLESLLRCDESPRGDYSVREHVWCIAAIFGQTARRTLQLLRTIFNEVSLSPYTQFVKNSADLVDSLLDAAAISEHDYLDFHGNLLRQLGRHLTAYDLVTFHHQGANYPDALLLDELLTRFVRRIDKAPGPLLGSGAAAQFRRRALRQACLLRRHYEGRLVPDAPTSPGENARVLPAPHTRVPEEQLLHQHRRSRRLFADNPLAELLGAQAQQVLVQSFRDLHDPAERAELGIG